MKRFPIVLTVIALGAAGFAAASIASGGHFVQMLTGTGDTVTTPTVTTVTTTPTVTTVTTTPTTTGEGGGGRRVTICHHTGSKKHPFHTITVDQHAVKAHLGHHDTLGACPTVVPTAPTTKKPDDNGGHGKGHGKAKGHDHVVVPTTSIPTTPTVTTNTETSHGKGHGKANGHVVAPTPSSPTTPTVTTTTDSSTHGNGNGNNGDNGNHGSGNNGHGHGKP